MRARAEKTKNFEMQHTHVIIQYFDVLEEFYRHNVLDAIASNPYV